MKKLLAVAVVFLFCSFSPSFFADTWAGNSYNQCVTFKALLNAESTSAIFDIGGTPPDTREVFTKADLTSYPISIWWYDGGWDISSTFSSFASGEAITKGDISGTIAALETDSGGAPLEAFQTFIYYLPPNVGIESIAVGNQLYTNRARTTTYSSGSVRYFSTGFASAIITVSTAGIITNINYL